MQLKYFNKKTRFISCFPYDDLTSKVIFGITVQKSDPSRGKIGGFIRGGESILRLYDEDGGEVCYERIQDPELDGTVCRRGIENILYGHLYYYLYIDSSVFIS